MPKKLTQAAIIKAAAGAGVVPEDADTPSAGLVQWHRDGLMLQLFLERKRRDGAFAWTLFVADGKFGPVAERNGSLASMAFSVRLIGDPSIPWPMAVDPEFEKFFVSPLGEARAFATGRSDFARIFASDSDVCRGSVYAWLPPAGFVGRLVGALIVARDAGDDKLAEEINAKLHSGAMVWGTSHKVDILDRAKDAAKGYSKRLGFEVEL
jgi:hypothetical protein